MPSKRRSAEDSCATRAPRGRLAGGGRRPRQRAAREQRGGRNGVDARKHGSGRRRRARASAGALPRGSVGQAAAVPAVLRPVPCASPGSAGPPPPSSLPLRPRRAGREATLAGSPGGKGSPRSTAALASPRPAVAPGVTYSPWRSGRASRPDPACGFCWPPLPSSWSFLYPSDPDRSSGHWN